jgi:hypothetical protein
LSYRSLLTIFCKIGIQFQNYKKIGWWVDFRRRSSGGWEYGVRELSKVGDVFCIGGV